MSVSIPNPMGLRIGAGGPPIAVAPLTLGISDLPKIQVGLDKLQVGLDKVQVALDKIQIGVDPLDVSIRLKEIPSVRMHLPAHFEIGLRVAGRELLCLRLCGEAQVITEPYVPNPAERCGSRPTLQPGPITHVPGVYVEEVLATQLVDKQADGS